MSKEAMKLALEALKQIDEAMPFPVAKLAQTALREALASEAIEQPAQQQEPEYKGWYCSHCQRGVDGSEVTYHEQHTVCGRVITDDLPPNWDSLWRNNEQPAQQEPKQSEIFCGVDFADGVLSVSVLRRRSDDVAELIHLEQIALPLAEPPAQQESVAWIVWGDKNVPSLTFTKPADKYVFDALYTSPPAQRTWVGLTDKDVEKLIPPWDCWTYEVGHEEAATFARTIEAKLKEKNT